MMFVPMLLLYVFLLIFVVVVVVVKRDFLNHETLFFNYIYIPMFIKETLLEVVRSEIVIHLSRRWPVVKFDPTALIRFV